MQDAIERYGSVDWASKGHVGCVVDVQAKIVDEFSVRHTALGLQALVQHFTRAGVKRVAIERPDGPVVEALRASGLEVVVVSSRAIKALRTRYSLAGNKADRTDAYVLADCLRTDGQRWASLEPDQPETRALRATVRARLQLVGTRVAVANQLRAHLEIVFPGAVDLFSRIDSLIGLRFLERFPNSARAAWLTERRLANWLASQGYSGQTATAQLWQRLHSAPPGQVGPAAEAQTVITLSLVKVLHSLLEQIDTLKRHIRTQLASHPDGPIFQSLPRAGTVRAATLLAEIGDCRARFPTSDMLASLAGAVPSTRSSGKHHVVRFRWSCDKHLRQAIVNYAEDTPRANLWAKQLYWKHRQLHKSHPHATRIVARAWIDIIWRCWQDRVPYDPARHRSLQRVLAEEGLT
jgi:transposase